jgi:hypothetical protein
MDDCEVVLITDDPSRQPIPYRELAHITIPRCDPVPRVIVWQGRVFHRFASEGGGQMRNGDIYKEVPGWIAP